MNDNRRTMRALLTIVFISAVPTTLILPMMPSLGTQFGVSPAELGFLVGIYPLMSMLASPFWGKLSDRYGRKPILICTLAGGALAFLVFALSSSWVGLFIARAMQGLAGTPRGISPRTNAVPLPAPAGWGCPIMCFAYRTISDYSSSPGRK